MYVPVFHNRHFSQEQIEELKEEINKTEYEKARVRGTLIHKEIEEYLKENKGRTPL